MTDRAQLAALGAQTSGGDWPADLGPPLRCGTLGAHVEQPAPSPGTGDVWQEVIDGLDLDDPIRPICIARRALGVARYGTPLQRGNGRDEVRDTDEELADALVYAQAEGDSETVEDCKRIMRRRLRRREGRR